MADYLEEEMQIMEENSSREETIKLSIDDPISSLDLKNIVGVKSGTSVKEVIEVLNKNNFGSILVLDEKENLVGIFTERDVLRKVVDRGLDLATEKIDDFMTKDPETLDEDDPIAFALNKMSDGSYRHIPITRNGKVQYMLSVKDIVDEIAFTYRKRVLNLPPDLRQQTSQYGG